MHLFLPSRKKYEGIPEGETTVLVEGERWVLCFRSIAVNTGWPADAMKRTNHFYKKLAEWFPHAAPSSKSTKGLKVAFARHGNTWHMEMPE
jgi:hypothetical protein